MEMLVSTEWLAQNLHEDDLVVLDASLHLPSAERDAAAEFAAAHIPGARFLNLAKLHDPASSMPGKIPDASSFEMRLSELGVGNGARIVLYDDSALRTACRAWFLLHLFGIERLAVLDGGLGKWRKEGRPLIEAHDRPARGDISCGDPNRAALRTKADMLGNIASGTEQVVDARDAERFAGTVEDHVHGLPGGHIPNACSLPFPQLLHEDGTFRPSGELRAAFEAAGIDITQPVVTTCGSGVTASVLAFALQLIGASDVALYDGSWAEWGADPDTPKMKGAAR